MLLVTTFLGAVAAASADLSEFSAPDVVLRFDKSDFGQRPRPALSTRRW
jgi:hypothetical protein